MQKNGKNATKMQIKNAKKNAKQLKNGKYSQTKIT